MAIAFETILTLKEKEAIAFNEKANATFITRKASVDFSKEVKFAHSVIVAGILTTGRILNFLFWLIPNRVTPSHFNNLFLIF